MSDFLTDVRTLRKRAREHMDKGPITDAYGADRDRVLRLVPEHDGGVRAGRGARDRLELLDRTRHGRRA